jgi:hypothetical protein
LRGDSKVGWKAVFLLQNRLVWPRLFVEML